MKLTWTRKVDMGVPTHVAGATVNGTDWHLVVDKPYRGTWVIRAWKGGTLGLYRETPTLAAAKELAEALIGDTR